MLREVAPSPGSDGFLAAGARRRTARIRRKIRPQARPGRAAAARRADRQHRQPRHRRHAGRPRPRRSAGPHRRRRRLKRRVSQSPLPPFAGLGREADQGEARSAEGEGGARGTTLTRSAARSTAIKIETQFHERSHPENFHPRWRIGPRCGASLPRRAGEVYVARIHLSGSGMNSVSPGTALNRPDFQSAFACSMRSRREETKFHQM